MVGLKTNTKAGQDGLVSHKTKIKTVSVSLNSATVFPTGHLAGVFSFIILERKLAYFAFSYLYFIMLINIIYPYIL